MMTRFANLKVYYRQANRDWDQMITNLHNDPTPAGAAHCEVADGVSANVGLKCAVLAYLQANT